jgi:hypothetical protein
VERPPGVEQALGQREGVGRGQQQVVGDAVLRLCVRGLGIAGLGIAGLGIAGLGVAGLGVAGLGVAGEGPP